MATDERHDVSANLAGSERDFLVRSNGEQVKISDVDWNTVGLYFSAAWCGPCQSFTPKLVEAYNELSSEGHKMEVVFISGDEDEEGFKNYFAKMPWLAIPFTDEDSRDRLNELFGVEGIPRLVVLNAKSGTIVSPNAVPHIREYGSAAYPFTPETISKLKEEEEAAKRNQTLKSFLVTRQRDYLISKTGDKVHVSSIEGKYVALFFTIPDYGSCNEISSLLLNIYEKVKEKGEDFEVVMICLEDDEESYNKELTTRPWLAIPFGDQRIEKLARYFELQDIPTLIMLDKNGKTLCSNVADLMEEHGVDVIEGFPYSPEKAELLAEKARAKKEKQTLESLLVNSNLDYVVGKDGAKVPVKDLVGKNICLYFSAHWCGPCRQFTPKLIEEYNKIRAEDSAFEIIFISSDQDQESYEEYFSSMPWLALPFKDERVPSLKKLFKIRGIPSLVALGPTGKTVNADARSIIMIHGASAYPFTEERVKELEEEVNKMVKGWPEKVKHALHEKHELVLTRMPSGYGCDGCNEMGHGWSYRCFKCDFDLHPKCALENDGEQGGNGDEVKAEEVAGEGYVCDGDVCRKV